MTEITIGELQEYFDDYIERVENGESLLIKGTAFDVVMIPAEEYDEFTRICSRH